MKKFVRISPTHGEEIAQRHFHGRSFSSSQYMRRMENRQVPVGVIQICWIAPGPMISATTYVVPAAISTDGLIFQPLPRSRAAFAPVPSLAAPPLPFSPVGFSGLIDKVRALESR